MAPLCAGMQVGYFQINRQQWLIFSNARASFLSPDQRVIPLPYPVAAIAFAGRSTAVNERFRTGDWGLGTSPGNTNMHAIVSINEQVCLIRL